MQTSSSPADLSESPSTPIAASIALVPTVRCRRQRRLPRVSRRRSSILKASLGLALVFCTTGATCTPGFRSPFAAWQPPAPEVLAPTATLDQVMSAVNQNAARIQSYQTNNASITVPGMPGIPLLRGNIAAQRPGRVRLQASTAITGPEVDLGANDELFWFWAKRNDPPALYFARHDQFATSAAKRMMPIEPQWLLDALGFAEFRPGDHHEGPLPLDKGRVEVKSVVQTPSGPITKRTIVDAHAWVVEQHVYDANGTLLASATARSHRYYQEAGVSLPQQIDLRIPASELSLSIDVGTVAINPLADSPQLWAMPVINGAPPIDLGAMTPTAATPKMGDQFTQGDWYGPGPAVDGPAPMALAATPGAPQSAVAPGATGAVAQGAQPAPQFLSPGGVAVSIETNPANALQQAQRLPAGGVTADGRLTR